MDQMQAASKMAGEWWAQRLNDNYAGQRDAFSTAVAKRIEQELRGVCYWDWFGIRVEGKGYEDHSETEFDYDPHNCLCEALAETIPNMSAMDRKECLPRKHHLCVYATRLVPKEGYGNWTAELRVPAVGAA